MGCGGLDGGGAPTLTFLVPPRRHAPSPSFKEEGGKCRVVGRDPPPGAENGWRRACGEKKGAARGQEGDQEDAQGFAEGSVGDAALAALSDPPDRPPPSVRATAHTWRAKWPLTPAVHPWPAHGQSP